MTREVAKLKIEGEGVTPRTLRLSDLIAFLEKVEKAIVSIIKSKVVDEDIKDEDIIISLIGIEESSVALKIDSPDQEIFHKAYDEFTSSIVDRDFKRLPANAEKNIREIIKLARRRNWRVEFYRDRNLPSAVITPQTELFTIEETWSGETTLYGQVERVGGREPKVRVRLIDGETITIDTNIEIAKELGRKLYSEVALEGEAIWNKLGQIVHFKINRIVPFEDKGVLNAFKELQTIAGSFWEGVNPEEEIEALRRAER